MLKRFAYVGIAIAVLYGAFVAGLYLFQDKLLFAARDTPFKDCVSAQTRSFKITDEIVDSNRVRFYLREGNPGNRGSIILFHGKGSSACKVTYYAEALKSLGLNFFIAEYPGFSDDPVKPSQGAFTRNAEVVFDFIRSRYPGPVFIFGESLGTGVATYLASVREPTGLILRTPYSSIIDIASGRYPLVPVSYLIQNPFPAEKWAESVKSPVIILHGTEDRTIPIELAHKLEHAFKSPLSFITIPGVDHNNIQDKEPGLFWGSIIRFVKGCLKGKCI